MDTRERPLAPYETEFAAAYAESPNHLAGIVNAVNLRVPSSGIVDCAELAIRVFETMKPRTILVIAYDVADIVHTCGTRTEGARIIDVCVLSVKEIKTTDITGIPLNVAADDLFTIADSFRHGSGALPDNNSLEGTFVTCLSTRPGCQKHDHTVVQTCPFHKLKILQQNRIG